MDALREDAAALATRETLETLVIDWLGDQAQEAPGWCHEAARAALDPTPDSASYDGSDE